MERGGTHNTIITDNISIVSIPLICISPSVIMMQKYNYFGK